MVSEIKGLLYVPDSPKIRSYEEDIRSMQQQAAKMDEIREDWQSSDVNYPSAISYTSCTSNEKSSPSQDSLIFTSTGYSFAFRTSLNKLDGI